MGHISFCIFILCLPADEAGVSKEKDIRGAGAGKAPQINGIFDITRPGSVKSSMITKLKKH